MTEPSDATVLIRQSAASIADRNNLRRIRALRYGMPGFDRTTWTAMCELGWPGLRISEEEGGSGLGMIEYCALAEELGAALVPEPLIATAMVAALLKGEALTEVLSGSRIILPAWQEATSTELTQTKTRLLNGRLHGRTQFVPVAAGADAFVVATVDGCALVDAKADGVQLDTAPTQDGGHYGTLILDGASASPVSGDFSGPIAEATLATAAYLLGMIEAALARTLDYLNARVQFGKPIGSFQALQHRCVDLKLQAVLTRASVEDAARQWDHAPASDAARAAISRAKARASSAAMIVTRQAIQLHGGIGFTDEHDIGLYLRKAMVLAPAFGSAEYHRSLYARLQPEMTETQR